MACKRSRNDIDLKTKYEIVQLLNQGLHQSNIAQKFNVNQSTDSRINKENNSYEKEVEFQLPQEQPQNPLL